MVSPFLGPRDVNAVDASWYFGSSKVTLCKISIFVIPDWGGIIKQIEDIEAHAAGVMFSHFGRITPVMGLVI